MIDTTSGGASLSLQAQGSIDKLLHGDSAIAIVEQAEQELGGGLVELHGREVRARRLVFEHFLELVPRYEAVARTICRREHGEEFVCIAGLLLHLVLDHSLCVLRRDTHRILEEQRRDDLEHGEYHSGTIDNEEQGPPPADLLNKRPRMLLPAAAEGDLENCPQRPSGRPEVTEEAYLEVGIDAVVQEDEVHRLHSDAQQDQRPEEREEARDDRGNQHAQLRENLEG
eukprot:CAMPEP_0176305558 /NCGR_PEP_ID=MMETSP0121_2-20121125/63020_1 /TAXON_ID=160619 /ORGANISM="Kryptoperidinium foliaceum, Strain CCMP 1326" /LENGTH=226 /DNA_ID=CAMNT_0017647223 /DNA_START=83 /DNA_END=761 /DNA_ORIENTATION=-